MDPSKKRFLLSFVSSYNDDFAVQQRLKENAKPAMFRRDAADKGKRKKVAESSGDDVNKVARAAKIVERMVNQNTFDDIAQVRRGIGGKGREGGRER